MEIQPNAGPLPDDDMVAAIVAVQLFLSAEAPAPPPEQEMQSGWQHAARLSTQGLRPAKLATPPRWSTIERLRRSTGGFPGVTGL